MAVELKLAVRDGWKQEDNKRFGQCLEIRFVDTVNDVILFRYAPLLADKPFWEDAFQKLGKYDDMHKEIFKLVSEIDGERFASFGECERIWCSKCGSTTREQKNGHWITVHKGGCPINGGVNDGNN